MTLPETEWEDPHPAAGRDRWRGAPQQYAVFVTLTQASAAATWRVSQLQVQE